MSQPPESLRRQANAFATDLSGLLTEALPKAPDAQAEASEDRVVIAPAEPVLLHVKDQPLGRLDLRMRCRLDSRGEWLAVEQSTFGLYANLDRTPVLRFDYVRDAKRSPSAHVQVHAHRGALSHLLSQAGHAQAHDMSKLHVPVGGARFRPCLEDVVQFLIEECFFDSLPTWTAAVERGRAKWRVTQASAVARDFPEEAAGTLRRLGYVVREPEEGVPERSARAMFTW